MIVRIASYRCEIRFGGIKAGLDETRCILLIIDEDNIKQYTQSFKVHERMSDDVILFEKSFLAIYLVYLYTLGIIYDIEKKKNDIIHNMIKREFEISGHINQ